MIAPTTRPMIAPNANTNPIGVAPFQYARSRSMKSCLVSTSTSFGSSSRSSSRAATGSAPSRSRIRPSWISSRGRSGNSRSQLSMLVITVPSMPNDGPISTSPTTFTVRLLTSVVIGPSASKRARISPNSGRDAASNSTTSCWRSSSRPAENPGVSNWSCSGLRPIDWMARRSVPQGFFQTAGKM